MVSLSGMSQTAGKRPGLQERLNDSAGRSRSLSKDELQAGGSVSGAPGCAHQSGFREPALQSTALPYCRYT